MAQSTDTTPSAPDRVILPERLRTRLAPVAGPLLIVAAVLVVMHGFWLHPKLTNQQVDLLAFWLPRWCSLGSNLAHGHIPTWLPNQFGGVPFVSDPQSGWLYLPVMLLFSTMSCARALGLFIVLQPMLAGLGMFGFFRHEGLGRPAATVGGLTLALTMTGSVVALSLPFAGTLAWTALSLAGASGYLHARTSAARWGWFVFTELALAQIAAAHLTDGLLIGVGVVFLYVVARLIAQVRSGERTWPNAFLVGAAPFLAFPVLSAAVLIPRLALLSRIPIGEGYVRMGELANRLSGTSAPPPIYFRGVGPWWGTSFARGPGGYVGALAILLIPAAFSARRWRLPAVAFALAGLAGWVLNLDRLIASGTIRRFVLAHRIGELWLRSPYRFRYLLIVALAALAGYGMQAWIDMVRAEGRQAIVRRAAWLAAPVVVFGLAPLVAGASIKDYVPFAIGVAYAVPLLLLASRGASWARVALPALLAVELTVVGLVAQGGAVPGNAPDRLETVASSGLGHSFPKFHAPFISPSDYLSPGPIARALIAAKARGDDGRYLAFNPGIAVHSPRGFLFHQDPETWPAYENGRSILFGIDEIQGYSPVQLDRYWRLVRAVDRKAPIFYNAATFQSIDPQVLALLDAEWLIQPLRLKPPVGGHLSAREGRYAVYFLGEVPRAVLETGYQVMPPGTSLSKALRGIPVVEDPQAGTGRTIHSGIPASPLDTATYSERDPEHVRIRTSTQGPALLVVRNAWDENWHATVDGKPARVLIADYMMQGVQVPAGRHVVELTYRDTAVGRGLIVSAVAWALLLLAWGLAWLRGPKVGAQA